MSRRWRQRATLMRRLTGTPLLLLLLLCAGCDLEWAQEAKQQYENGLVAMQGRNFAQARTCFEKALAANPYHPQANYSLALCLDERYQDEAAALVYYKRYLDLPDPDAVTASTAQMRIQRLESIAAGMEQDPVDTLNDIHAAAKQGVLDMFIVGIHPERIAQAAAQKVTPQQLMQQWKTKPEVIQRTFLPHAGENCAVLVLREADGFSQLVMRPNPDLPGSWLVGARYPLTE